VSTPDARVIALWKPYGVVSRFTPAGGHAGLGTLLEEPGVWPVGRLDHDSEGLLLLTDDGALAHRLTTPGYAHPRTYWVQVEHEPGAAALAALAEGVVIQGRRTLPAAARRLDAPPALPPRPVPIRVRKSIPTAWLELTLYEGRNRQVRRMTAAVGHPTLRLIRSGVGPLRLMELGLAAGEWRPLTHAETDALYASAAAKSASRARPRANKPGAGSRLRTS
jgi:23S rRNA pseudouridine2457 synthase